MLQVQYGQGTYKQQPMNEQIVEPQINFLSQINQYSSISVVLNLPDAVTL